MVDDQFRAGVVVMVAPDSYITSQLLEIPRQMESLPFGTAEIESTENEETPCAS
jgi:hypothetical protein